MKKAISILLVVCLAVMLPLTALAGSDSVTIKDQSYTWNGQKVVKPVFSGDKAVAAKLNEVMYDTYREFQFIGQRATNYAKKPDVVIDYTVYYNADSILSMSVNMGVMNPVEGYASELKYFIMFDLATGAAIHWEDIIDENEENQAFLLGLFNYGFNALKDGDADTVIEELPLFDAFYFDGENLITVYSLGVIDDTNSYEFSLPLGAYVGMAKGTALKALIDAADEFTPPSTEDEESAEEPTNLSKAYIYPNAGVIFGGAVQQYVYTISYATLGTYYVAPSASIWAQ